MRVDDSFRADGLRTRSGASMVQFYKAVRRAGRWHVCIGTTLVSGDGFFSSGFENQVLSRTKALVNGDTLLSRLEGNVPVERKKDVAPPAEAACFDTGLNAESGRPPIVSFDYPTYIRVVE